ncbi:uncharacterized protein ARMOST_19469 [Armillaria ostoyae]|uniref:Uncharacterized protein n=1 Tax=Armillaria ostoyae TaxID=47428 RepID=A0A284S4P1_ARMOS|nr:uncharacterized protein ARMOST_19469 [Armillaria ostoyae]
MKFTPTTFITLLSALSGVTTLPLSEFVGILPRDITHVAVDETHRDYLAFKRDGSLYGRYPVNVESSSLDRRASSQCGKLSVDESKTLPGWDAIEKYANDNLGNGSRNIVTNPTQYLDQPALVCITNDVSELTFSGDPTCQMQNASADGGSVGASGEVDIEVDQGFSTNTSYTITNASTIGVSQTLTAEIGVPEIAKVTNELTISAEVTGTASSSFDVSYSNVRKITVKVTAPEGKNCTTKTSTNTCNIQASGNIRYLASGWIWFNYNDVTKGHYKWGVQIEAVLTNQDDRSSFAAFKGSMVAVTKTHYASTCV